MLWFFTACGFMASGPEVIVEAHRGGAGYNPQNSRSAILHAIDRNYDAIEFDLVLTNDLVPVLSHDPWVHTVLCTRSDGTELGEEGIIYIQDLTLDELQTDFLCGAVRDEELPDANLLAETTMTFDEVIDGLSAVPDMVVHLDIKYEPGQTQSPDAFAEAILGPWLAADLPNPWYMSANLAEATNAFKDYHPDTKASLSWPRFTEDTSDAAVALKGDLAQSLGTVDYVAMARNANADALALPYQVAEVSKIREARAAGLEIQIWTVNDEALFRQVEKWPVDAIITDYPEFGR